MSESKKVRALKLLGGLVAVSVLAMGCSSAPPGESTAAPAVTDPGVSPEMTTQPSSTNLIPATPIPSSCIYYNGLTYVTLPANYAVKLPNNWGQPFTTTNSYGVTPNARYGDGYSIPFPTPWLRYGSTEATYEMALWEIPSTLWWEYLVRVVTPPPSGSRYYTEDLTRAYFLVGIPAIGDYTRAYNLAQQYSALPVEARVNKCVRILTASGGYVYDTGEYFLVFDEHDPVSPPWLT